jgi:uncharacterized protein YbcV (DUF1398 family)
MDTALKAVMKECTIGSDEERLNFPQVVMKLMEAGVEQYHADLRRAEKTYYMPNGESLALPAAAVDTPAAQAFQASDVEAAVRTIQAGGLTYKAFCERIAAAGCVGYLVSLAGRRAVYYGRSGETYVEPFPGAA